MHRSLYLLGAGYLAICGVLVLRHQARRSRGVEPGPTSVQIDGSGSAWFAGIKSHCNVVEVELAQRGTPAPAALDGQAFSAACYALGGKLDSARAVIDRLPADDRYKAAGIVFDVAHPVADA